MVQEIATAVSKPVDHTRLIICLFLQMPIGFVMNMFITSPGTPRYLYSLIVGVLLQVYMFREAVYHIYIYYAVGYLILNVLPRN